jgi:type I restriction enzyme M protein
MLTGQIRNQIDQVWDAFWSGGLSNPLAVIEQLTYLLFIRRLDELQTARENKANRLKKLVENPIFPAEGEFQPDERSSVSFPYQLLRWSRFKNLEPRQMYEVIANGVFPFIKTQLTGDESPFTRHMQAARFGLAPEKAGLVAKVVEMLDAIEMEDRDTKGDLYEYLLSKLSAAGHNGQFRTPRHIIRLMVDLTAPTPNDTICDPACGTAGFLVAAAEHLRDHHKDTLTRPEVRERFNGPMFHGFDFDSTMLRIASMNLLLHGIEQPDIRDQDSLAQTSSSDVGAYSLILANPPFAGSLDYDSTAPTLLKIVKTQKTELLFLALFLQLLQPGGRAAVIVPDGVLFGSSGAHQKLRELLVERHRLQGVISMPAGVFRPYSGVSTAILLFTRTDSGGTEHVWFYDMQAEGFSLDDKRTPLGNGSGQTHEQNNIPDIRRRWQQLAEEQGRPRTAQSFMVPKAEIAANSYDLSINRYKEIQYQETEYDPPQKILDELEALEREIMQDMAELREMLA